MQKSIYDFYCNKENGDKIMMHLYNREFAYLFPEHLRHKHKYGGNRFIKVSENVKFFNWFFQWGGQARETDPVNLYHSVAKFKNLPDMPFKMDQYREFKSFWRNNWSMLISSFDFVVDIDCPDHKHMHVAKDDTIEILSCLENKFGVKGQVRFSGKGFHVYYYYDLIKKMLPDHSFDEYKDNNIYDIYKGFAVELKDNLTDWIDTSIYDPYRLIKCPSSLVFYPDGCYYSCILSFDNLKKFDLKKYEVHL